MDADQDNRSVLERGNDLLRESRDLLTELNAMLSSTDAPESAREHADQDSNR